MAHVLGPDLEPGGTVNADWKPYLLGNIAIPLISNDALTQQELELLRNYEWVVELSRSATVPDVMGTAGTNFAVSQRVRDWVTEHQTSQP